MATAPPIDFSRIPFPTDTLTIGAIRSRDPARFQDYDSTLTDFEGVLMTERIVAEKAYAAALRLPDPHPDWQRDDLTLALMDCYKHYGLTTGIKHTRELKNAIEAAATAQAQEHSGRSR